MASQPKRRIGVGMRHRRNPGAALPVTNVAARPTPWARRFVESGTLARSFIVKLTRQFNVLGG